VLNLRVSKMGGLLRSLEVARAARRLAIPIVVGAQVGETSFLTRASLPVAREAGDLLLAQEGAFGDRLLVRDPCDPSLAFGRGGLLAAPGTGKGFGVAVGARE
jgi:L-alanine-DL-glutamate epimerase-like enolase superfamily enzyme